MKIPDRVDLRATIELQPVQDFELTACMNQDHRPVGEQGDVVEFRGGKTSLHAKAVLQRPRQLFAGCIKQVIVGHAVADAALLLQLREQLVVTQ